MWHHTPDIFTSVLNSYLQTLSWSQKGLSVSLRVCTQASSFSLISHTPSVPLKPCDWLLRAAPSHTQPITFYGKVVSQKAQSLWPLADTRWELRSQRRHYGGEGSATLTLVPCRFTHWPLYMAWHGIRSTQALRWLKCFIFHRHASFPKTHVLGLSLVVVVLMHDVKSFFTF